MQSNRSVVLQFIEKVLNRGEVDAAGEFKVVPVFKTAV